MSMQKTELEKRRAKIIELYEKGLEVYEIAEAIGVNRGTVHNALTIAGITLQKERGINESNLVYADNSIPELETVVIDGKIYTDITPLFAPR